MFGGVYQGKRVFVTGHTGFKGSWLCEWLLTLGAEVAGYSDCVGEPRNHFSRLALESRIDHVLGDVNDAKALAAALHRARPDFVFHLAAQSLVRPSYADPAGTMATNVMGTVNLLEALRVSRRAAICVVVTSDKCYENREVIAGYREEDPLGGRDPYSASKGAAEILIHSYRRSFFSAPDSRVRLTSARAGNVIGGGDWAEHRIVPDCVRSLIAGEEITVRNPRATRPWQHVLEPLSGYLWLAALMSGRVDMPGPPAPAAAEQPFNFGPWPTSNRSVQTLVEEVLKHWPGGWRRPPATSPLHEAGLLSLSIEKAYHLLKWEPVLDFAQTVAMTVEWYRKATAAPETTAERTCTDIGAYGDAARTRGVLWAQK